MTSPTIPEISDDFFTVSSSHDLAHVWLLRSDRDAIAGAWEAQQVLDAKERARAHQIHSVEARQRFILARSLVRQTLSRYQPRIAPDAWCFDTNEFGKPFLAGPALEVPLQFNLSHSAEWIALAVTTCETVGIDVQHMTERPDTLPIARRFFTAREFSDLEALPPAEQLQRFHALWTVKEACSKARGQGLYSALRHYAVGFPGATGLAVQFSEEEKSETGWNLWLYKSGSYNLALVLGQGRGGQQQTPVLVSLDTPGSSTPVPDPEFRLTRASSGSKAPINRQPV